MKCSDCDRPAQEVVTALPIFVQVDSMGTQEIRTVPAHYCRQCADHCKMQEYVVQGGRL